MNVVIYTSNKTAWALRPFAHLMRFYWSSVQPVIVFGNDAPPFKLPHNFTFHSIGPFQPVNRWSDGLLTALEMLRDEVFCLMLDDYWINRMVDQRGIEDCYQYMLDHPEVARFDMTTDRLYAAGITDYGRVGRLDVIQSDPKSPYHFSYQAALWRRDLLRQCLVAGETPWESEMKGDGRLRALGALVLGTRQSPIHYTIAIQQGKFTPDGGYQTPTNAMPQGDADYIMAQDWIPSAYLDETVTA